jgi:predicted MFS family arabinose efflux permease
MNAESARRRTFASLSSRNFRLYFLGQLVSISGTWMQSMALNWLVLQVTHNSTLNLGVNFALQWLPTLLFGVYGGLIVDRSDKRRILFVTQSLAGLLALALGVLVSTGHVTMSYVFLISLTLGFVNLFDMPARQAFVQEMVGRDLITNAVSLNSVLMNAGRIVGPSIASIVIALAGIAACFYANAASYAAVIIALALMRSSELMRIRTVEREKRQIREGLACVRRMPLLRDLLITAAIVGTFAFNFTITLPALAKITFDSSALGFGAEMSAMGVGAMFGGLYVAHRQNPTRRLLAGLGIAFGVFLAGVALAPTIVVATILLVPTGGCAIAFISTVNAMMQLNSAEEMRGRVMSLYSTAFLGTTPIGALVIALIMSATSPRVGILVGAGLTLGTGLVLAGALRKSTASTTAEAASPA